MSVDVSSDSLVGRMALVEGELAEVMAVHEGTMVCRRVRDHEVLAGDAPVVLLPRFGDYFRLPSDEVELGIWIDVVRESSPDSSKPLQVRAWVQGDMSTVPLFDTPVCAGEASAEVQGVLEALVLAQRGRQEDKAAAQARLDSIIARAHEEADDRGMCTEFDDFMENVGLPRRVREYEFRVSLSATVYVTGEGSDEDAAWESISGETIRSLVDVGDLEIDDYEVS